MIPFVLLTNLLFHTFLFGQQVNKEGLKMIPIASGEFLMGSRGNNDNYDESPAHVVVISKPFAISATEVTNAQYERFDPGHQKLRGKYGFSKLDDEAVVFVSFDEATAYCRWLSAKEGGLYRLPTEAEWEYACRAGTLTDYNMGNTLPANMKKNQTQQWEPLLVNLSAGKTTANAWGLFDMHGNVEEWCSDWYGAYDGHRQTDPVGRAAGWYKVTRGGSHSTGLNYLRSANRSAMIPGDKTWLVGFRVVRGNMSLTRPLHALPKPQNMQKVKQGKHQWKLKKGPFFATPVNYIKKPDCPFPPYYDHQHCPAITWFPNGDLMAIWFSTQDEAGREMVILASRLRAGHREWDLPSIFFQVADRNVTGSSLLYDQKSKLIYHLNGLEASGSWQNLAMVMRTSKDNGANWSAPVLIDKEHQKGNQVIAGMFESREGWLIQPADASPGAEGGTVLHISKDQGKSWARSNPDGRVPDFKPGEKGGLIAGIHAGVVQLKNGNLLALGRGNAIDGHMPVSISDDMGQTWRYTASPFPPIGGGQRLVLRRLDEGPLLFVSFTNDPEKDAKDLRFKGRSGTTYEGFGLYAALSYDEGKTWPVKKLLTNGKTGYWYGGAWTGYFKMDYTHAEPKGYLAATQTPDHMIHLISSAIYYEFNLDWLLE